MTTTRRTVTFDLLIPSNGQGPSHLRTEHTVGFVCGTRTGRKTFQMIGIVGSNAGTCDACRQGARAIENANR